MRESRVLRCGSALGAAAPVDCAHPAPPRADDAMLLAARITPATAAARRSARAAHVAAVAASAVSSAIAAPAGPAVAAAAVPARYFSSARMKHRPSLASPRASASYASLQPRRSFASITLTSDATHATAQRAPILPLLSHPDSSCKCISDDLTRCLSVLSGLRLSGPLALRLLQSNHRS